MFVSLRQISMFYSKDKDKEVKPTDNIEKFYLYFIGFNNSCIYRHSFTIYVSTLGNIIIVIRFFHLLQLDYIERRSRYCLLKLFLFLRYLSSELKINLHCSHASDWCRYNPGQQNRNGQMFDQRRRYFSYYSQNILFFYIILTIIKSHLHIEIWPRSLYPRRDR